MMLLSLLWFCVICSRLVPIHTKKVLIVRMFRALVGYRSKWGAAKLMRYSCSQVVSASLSPLRHCVELNRMARAFSGQPQTRRLARLVINTWQLWQTHITGAYEFQFRGTKFERNVPNILVRGNLNLINLEEFNCPVNERFIIDLWGRPNSVIENMHAQHGGGKYFLYMLYSSNLQIRDCMTILHKSNNEIQRSVNHTSSVSVQRQRHSANDV